VAAQARGAGFDHYFEKPVDPDELLDALDANGGR
jgi:DNA-binding response OmpR family regulator